MIFTINLLKNYLNKLERYDNKNVICCGTIISEYNTIMEYLLYYVKMNSFMGFYKIPRCIGQGIYIDYCYKK